MMLCTTLVADCFNRMQLQQIRQSRNVNDRVIQSSRTILKQNVNSFVFLFFSRFTTVKELWLFSLVSVCIIVIVNFYKIGTILFNIACHLITLFAIKRKKDRKLCPLDNFEIVTWEYFFLSTFCLCDGNLSEHWLHITTYDQSALPPFEHTLHSNVKLSSWH